MGKLTNFRLGHVPVRYVAVITRVYVMFARNWGTPFSYQKLYTFICLERQRFCLGGQDQFGAPVQGQNITKKMYEKVAPHL